MARHGGGPPPRSAIPGRGPSTTSAGVIVALVGAVFAVVTVLCLSVLGVPILPRQQAAAAASPSPTPSPTIDRVALQRSPAQTVITTALGPAVATGWVPAGTVSWSGGTPFDAACGRPTVDAVLSGARVYTVGRTQVVLTVSAHAAGAGAVAMRDWATRLAACSAAQVTTTPVAVPSADAFVASMPAAGGAPGATAVFWRRGDVVAIIALPRPAAVGMPILAGQVDPALAKALTGVCANQASTVADAVRSPWVSREQFVGLASPIPVTVAPSPTPVPPAGLVPVPPTWSPAPLPSVSTPLRPAEPVWPADLPAEVVESPLPPSVLAPAPTLSLVPSRLDDPTGPGCGWAFTGQLAPPFDAVTEPVLAQGRVTQAKEDLVAAQSAWQVAVLDYWQSVADYSARADAYTAYAAAVREVARAWDRITAQRQAYADAVDRYNAAVAVREQFLLDQAAAQAQYDDAVAMCQALSPTPSTTATATATPAATPSATDGPVVPECPPAEPPILTQLPPAVPPAPTPPPDPRPTS